MSDLTFQCQVHFKQARHGRKQIAIGEAPPPPTAPAGRVPRVARLMALAIRFDELLRRGEVRDYADLARLGHVTRARVTQIMNLLNLAPDIQEDILCLPRTMEGRDPIKEWQVRPIAANLDWSNQRGVWRAVRMGDISSVSYCFSRTMALYKERFCIDSGEALAGLPRGSEHGEHSGASCG